jgi:hypothetical protein
MADAPEVEEATCGVEKLLISFSREPLIELRVLAIDPMLIISSFKIDIDTRLGSEYSVGVGYHNLR